MIMHREGAVDSGVVLLPVPVSIPEQRIASVGFGGERRGSQSEPWAMRNRLRCAALADTEGSGTAGVADVIADCRLVCSCELETLDEAH